MSFVFLFIASVVLFLHGVINGNVDLIAATLLPLDISVLWVAWAANGPLKRGEPR